ncbi:hypothetical protein IAQ61_009345 [Plenodomus lingam]|uniref:uncharacterized protein n=1 Tax=Leptosphaeria maculans TaxID=5022 RepID=UPI003332247C|nr:hypothetical protein IAQ61_009345 [Plenodomus lingam]
MPLSTPGHVARDEGQQVHHALSAALEDALGGHLTKPGYAGLPVHARLRTTAWWTLTMRGSGRPDQQPFPPSPSPQECAPGRPRSR